MECRFVVLTIYKVGIVLKWFTSAILEAIVLDTPTPSVNAPAQSKMAAVPMACLRVITPAPLLRCNVINIPA